MISLRSIGAAVIACVSVLVAVGVSAASAAPLPARHQVAKATIDEAFPGIWRVGYDRVLPFGVGIGRMSATEYRMAATVDGRAQRVVAKGLFGFVAADGSTRAIDTRLASRAGGWVPRAVGFELTLPASYASGVRFGGRGETGMTVVPVGVSDVASAGSVVGGEQDHVLWPDVWTSTDAVATVLGDGMREHLVVRSDRGPSDFSWAVKLDAPAASLGEAGGGVELRVPGRAPRQLMRPPVAVDAAGREVEVTLGVEQRQRDYLITLHRGAAVNDFGRWTGTTYPVAIDPDLVAPSLGPTDFTCEESDANGDPADVPGLSAYGSTNSVAIQYASEESSSNSFDGESASCTIPSPDEGGWVSLSGTAEWSINSDEDVFEATVSDGANELYADFAGSTSPSSASFSWAPGGSPGAAPDGDVDVTLASVAAVTMSPLSDPAPPASPLPAHVRARHFGLSNLVRVYRMPAVLGANANTAASDVGAGFQVTHATGNVTTQKADVTQPAYAGTTLELSRTYNSQDEHVGLLGQGWSTSYERRLEWDGADATYVAADGARWAFASTGTDTWDLAWGYVGTLRQTADVGARSGEPVEILYPDGRLERFDSAGRLTREVWPMGNEITYGAASPVSGGSNFTISDGHGHSITAHVDSSTNRLSWVKDSLDQQWDYGYTSGMLTSVTAPDTGVWEYAYGTGGRMASAADPLDRPTEFGYDSGGFATSVEDAGNATRTLAYDVVDGETTDTFGTHVTSTTYDVDNGAVDVAVNAAGDPTVSEYNERGQVTSFTDENEETTETGYTSGGCVSHELDPEGNETTYSSFSSAPGCNPQSVLDAEGNTTTSTYDSDGNKLTETTPSPDSQTTAWTYDDAPQPESMNPPAGATIDYTYDATGQVTDQAWTDGASTVHHVERTTYDAKGQRLSNRPGDVAATTFTYDELGRLERTTDPLTDYTESSYDLAGQLQTVRDKNGGVTDYDYDARGNQTSADTPEDPESVSVYDQYGNVSSVTDPRGKITSYTYDEVGNELTQVDPLNRTTSSSYDDAGNQLTETLPGGITTTYGYDGNGNEELVTYPGGTVTSSTSYTDLQNTHVETDERAEPTTYGYDAVGREVSVTNADGGIDETLYDAAGRIEARENGLDQPTQYTLDPAGRITQTEHPDLTTRSSTWDDAGRETARSDEEANPTTLGYDSQGRVLSELRADGGLWQYTYDGNGNRLTVEDPEGGITTTTYDANDQLLTSEDPEGGDTTYAYDDAGNLETVTDPRGKVTTYGYDDANERTLMDPPGTGSTSYTYTVRGELDTEVTGGVTTDYDYDDRGRLTTVTRGSSVTSYTHDDAGNVLTHTMPDGQTITYTYDGVGRRTSEDHPVRGDTVWVYDLAGRISSSTTDAGATSFARDSMGRVTTATYPSPGGTAAYTYDDTGTLLTVTDAGGTRTFTRDAEGRVETFTTRRNRDATHWYDDAGRIEHASMESIPGTPSSRVHQYYTYDAAGRLTDLDTGHGTITYTYTPDGKLETKTLPGSLVITYTYDDRGRVASQTMTGEPLLTSSYDAEDRITQVDKTVSGVTTVEAKYAYSAEGRLLSWTGPNEHWRTDYDYDADGNLEEISRVVLTPPAGTNTTTQNSQLATCFSTQTATCVTYSTDLRTIFGTDLGTTITNPTAMTGTQAQVARYMATHSLPIRTYVSNSLGQLTSTKTTTTGTTVNFTYDSRGNTVTGSPPGPNAVASSTQTVTYDHENRVKREQFAGSVWVSSTWNSDGTLHLLDREGTTVNDAQFDYDDQGRMVNYTTTSGITADVIYDPFGVAMTYGTPGARFAYYNPRGDLLALSGSTGTIVNRFTYTPWGQLTFTGGDPTTFPFRYDGRDGVFMNGTTNQLWMGARFYSPDSARFRQADPVPAQEGTADTGYSYAGNDPVNHRDPNGTDCLLNTVVLYREKNSLFARGWGIYGDVSGDTEDIKCDEFVESRSEPWPDCTSEVVDRDL